MFLSVALMLHSKVTLGQALNFLRALMLRYCLAADSGELNE